MPDLNNSADEQGGTTEVPAEPTKVRDANGRLIKEGEPEETPLEALASICTVIVIALFAFSFIGQNFMIPSASMENTLLIGDHLLVDRTTFAAPTTWAPFVHYRPVQRGDIIVFLKEPDSFWKESGRLAGIETDILYDTGAVINALPFSAGAYRDSSPLMHELSRDGLDL